MADKHDAQRPRIAFPICTRNRILDLSSLQANPRRDGINLPPEIQRAVGWWWGVQLEPGETGAVDVHMSVLAAVGGVQMLARMQVKGGNDLF